MTERREKRNEEIRGLFEKLRKEGLSVDDTLEQIAGMSYAIAPETVRRIVYDKNYCKRCPSIPKKLNSPPLGTD